MVFCWALSLVLASGLFAGSQDQTKPPEKKADPQKLDDDDATPPKKPRPSTPKLDIDDALKRAYHKARTNDEDAKVQRFSGFKSCDADGNEAILCIFEYETKDMAFYLGSKDPMKDQWFYIERGNIAEIEEALRRNR